MYSELTTTCILFADKEQATALLGYHIAKHVKVAVFPQWHSYLVQQGRLDRLVHHCTCYGGVQLWAVSLDMDGWTRIIQAGLGAGTLTLPQ